MSIPDRYRSSGANFRWLKTHGVLVIQLLGITIAVGSLVGSAYFARRAAQYQAWQTLNSASGKAGNCGRILALQDLARQHVSLRGLDLQGRADLAGIKLPHADLIGARLDSADLRYADLSYADLCGASLIGARLDRADLRYADLAAADLTGAEFIAADLRGACLASTDMGMTALLAARLEGAVIAWRAFDQRQLTRRQRQMLHRYIEHTALSVLVNAQTGEFIQVEFPDGQNDWPGYRRDDASNGPDFQNTDMRRLIGINAATVVSSNRWNGARLPDTLIHLRVDASPKGFASMDSLRHQYGISRPKRFVQP